MEKTRMKCRIMWHVQMCDAQKLSKQTKSSMRWAKNILYLLFRMKEKERKIQISRRWFSPHAKHLELTVQMTNNAVGIETSVFIFSSILNFLFYLGEISTDRNWSQSICFNVSVRFTFHGKHFRKWQEGDTIQLQKYNLISNWIRCSFCLAEMQTTIDD